MDFGNIVIVCQGGGASGSWEAGFLDKLIEFPQITDSICAISGTSVGGLNAALLCQKLNDRSKPNLGNVWLNARAVNMRLFFFCNLRRLIRETVDSCTISNGKIFLYITATASRRFLPFYIKKSYQISDDFNKGLHLFAFGPKRLQNQTQDTDVHVALSSTSALPPIYPAINHRGLILRDGGLVANNPVDIANKSNFNTMIILCPKNPCNNPGHFPITSRIYRNTQIRLLKARESKNKFLADRNKNILLVYPSEEGKVPGVLGFNSNHIQQGYNAGVADATEFLQSANPFQEYDICNSTHFNF